MTLTFDAATHTYRCDGIIMPSVTQVMKAAGLGQPYGHVDADTLERAADRGRLVHWACAEIDSGRQVDPVWIEGAEGYIAAYRLFARETGYRSDATEEYVCHARLGYAGQLDMRGWMHGRRIICDRKATASLHRDTAVQCAGYELAAHQHIRGLYGLWLRPNGTYQLRRYYDSRTEQVFLAALTLYRDPNNETAWEVIRQWNQHR
jgi:hypothetical protein